MYSILSKIKMYTATYKIESFNIQVGLWNGKCQKHKLNKAMDLFYYAINMEQRRNKDYKKW